MIPPACVDALVDPVTLRQAIAELLDECDLWHAHALAMWRDGYHAGAIGEYERGYQQAIADVKAAEHALVDYLRGLPADDVRWALRGEPRVRATFGQPHKDDYPGNGAA